MIQQRIYYGSHAPVLDRLPFLRNPVAELKHNCPKCNNPGTYKGTRKGVVRMGCAQCPGTWAL